MADINISLTINAEGGETVQQVAVNMDGVSEATKEAQEAVQDYAETVADASSSAADFAAAIDGLSSVVDSLSEQMEGLSEGLEGVGEAGEEGGEQLGIMGSVLEGMGLGAGVEIFEKLGDAIKEGVSAIPEMVMHLAETGEQMQNLSERTGLSTTELQKMQFAGAAVGIGVDQMAQAFVRFEKNAETGTGNVAAVMQQLGLSLDQLKSESPDQAFEQLLGTLAQLPPGIERVTAAQTLLGRTGVMLLPLVEQFGSLSSAAEGLGVVMSTGTIASAHDLQEDFNVLGQVVTGVANNFASFIVTSEPLHILMEGLIQIVGQFSVYLQNNGDAIRGLVDTGIVLLVNGLVTLSSTIPSVITALAFLVKAAIGVQTGFQEMAILAGAAFAVLAAHGQNAGIIMRDAMSQVSAANDQATASFAKIDTGAKAIGDGVATASAHMRDLATAVEQAEGKTHTASEESKTYALSLGNLGKGAKSAGDSLKSLQEEEKAFSAQMEALGTVGANLGEKLAQGVNADPVSAAFNKVEAEGDAALTKLNTDYTKVVDGIVEANAKWVESGGKVGISNELADEQLKAAGVLYEQQVVTIEANTDALASNAAMVAASAEGKAQAAELTKELDTSDKLLTTSEKDLASATKGSTDGYTAQVDSLQAKELATLSSIDADEQDLQAQLAVQESLLDDSNALDADTVAKIKNQVATIQAALANDQLAASNTVVATDAATAAAALKQSESDVQAMETDVSDLSKILTNLGVSSTSELAQLVSSVQEGAKAFEQFEKAGGDAGAAITAVLGAAASAQQGQMGSAIGSAVGGIGGGAIGGAIAGPIGSAIGSALGSAIGGAIGSLFNGTPQWEKDAQSLGTELGTTISESMSKQIESDAAKSGNTVFVQGYLDLDKVIQASGQSALTFGHQTQELMAGIQSGTIPAAQGLQTVDTIFTAMTTDAKNAGDSFNATVTATLQQARATGTLTASMNSYVSSLQDAAESGAKLIAQGYGEEGNAADTGISSKDFQAQGTAAAQYFAYGFQDEITQKGLVAALSDMGSQLDTFYSQLKANGDTAGEALLQPYENLEKEITGPVKGSLDTLTGMDQVFQSMAANGDLTASSFQGMESSVAATSASLTKAGVSTSNISLATYQSLKDVVSASQEYGFTLDGNTQKLVAQAQAAGYAFPEAPEQKMLDVLTDIDHLLGGKYVGDMQAAGATTASSFSTANAQISATSVTAQRTVAAGWQSTATQVNESVGTLTPSAKETFDQVGQVAHDQAVYVANVWGGQTDSIRDKILKAAPDIETAFTAIGTAATGQGSGLLKIVAAVGQINTGLGLIPGYAAVAGSALAGMPGPGAGAGGAGPEGAGGKTLPHLAGGGFVTSPTLAMIGEAGPELVLPLTQYPISSPAPLPGFSSVPGVSSSGGGGGTVSVENHFHYSPTIQGGGKETEASQEALFVKFVSGASAKASSALKKTLDQHFKLQVGK